MQSRTRDDEPAFWSAVSALSLTLTGSSILPMPYTLSRTSVLVFVAVMAFVGLLNSYTSKLLLNASDKTGTRVYESLADAAGGRRLRVMATASMLLLLFGTVCGSIVVQGDAALRIAEGLGVFQAGDATRVLWGLGPLDLSMIGIAACLLLPMSLLRHLRSLEVAALASVPAFAALVLVLAGDCVAWGFPGVRSGEVAWVVPNAGWAGVLEAIAIIGFADYCQPVLLPLLAEMPEGPVGLRTTKRAVDFTIFVFGTACYFSTAFFGAAAFGSRVRGNIVSNALLPSVAASVVLQGAILIYTSLTCIPIVIALRTTIDALLFGKDGRGRGGPFSAASHFFKTAAIVGACLFVALIMKGHSEVVFSITGATGVCLICYVAPAAVHISLWYRDRVHPESARCSSCGCVGYKDGQLLDCPEEGCACVPSAQRAPGVLSPAALRRASVSGGAGAEAAAGPGHRSFSTPREAVAVALDLLLSRAGPLGEDGIPQVTPRSAGPHARGWQQSVGSPGESREPWGHERGGEPEAGVGEAGVGGQARAGGRGAEDGAGEGPDGVEEEGTLNASSKRRRPMAGVLVPGAEEDPPPRRNAGEHGSLYEPLLHPPGVDESEEAGTRLWMRDVTANVVVPLLVSVAGVGVSVGDLFLSFCSWSQV